MRKPAVAGMFYPDDSEELLVLVNNHLNRVTNSPEIDGQILALIVPHAGLIYSGQIAAYGYKLLDNSNINKVILCGPSHRFAFAGNSIFGPGVSWRTPLGQVKCNDELCQNLLQSGKGLKVIPEAHRQEHSLEVQLPYLQTVLNEFEIVPIVMGRQDAAAIGDLADVLEKLEFDNQTIMIAATDWQHFMPAEIGWPLDSLGIDCIINLDDKRLEQYLSSEQTKACGGGPTVAVLRAARTKGADKAILLKYGDSGDVTGDKSSVVSYVAAVIYRSSESNYPDLADQFLSDGDKDKLLKIARQSIKTFLKTKKIPKFDVPPKLEEPGAAFVTLNKNGRLRGCIGHTKAIQPLYQTVAECAIQAAVGDSRFYPVNLGELDKIHIEISVLTPIEEVKSIDEIEVGRDGLMIFKGSRRGLLLPQVATEYGWSRVEFLEQTCRKAGLDLNDYKSDDATIYKFQAIIFGE